MGRSANPSLRLTESLQSMCTARACRALFGYAYVHTPPPAANRHGAATRACCLLLPILCAVLAAASLHAGQLVDRHYCWRGLYTLLQSCVVYIYDDGSHK